MTETLRGPLLTAQREISALDIRRRVILQKVNNTEQEEKGAYINATNWQETLQNTAKKAGYVSHHAKLKTELGMVDVQIKDFKQVFGLELFAVLMDLEDKEGWLPTVRDIRSIYDQARRDIEKIQVRQKEKEAELIKLGGTPIIESAPSSALETSPDDPNKGTGTAGSYFKQIAAVEAQSQQQQQQAIPMAQAVPVVGMESIRSMGGPLSYSIPSAVPTSTSLSQPPPSHYSDPFHVTSLSTPSTMTSTYPPPPPPSGQQQQQQQQLPPLTAPINPMFAYNDATKAATTTSVTTTSSMDPFAGMYSSNSNNNISSNNQSTTTTATTTTTTGFGFMGQSPMGGNAMTFPSSLPNTTNPNMATQSYVDPFAVSTSSSFAPQPSYQNTSAVEDDPFAMLSTTTQQQQQQPATMMSSYPSTSMNPSNHATNNTSNNPLFRY